MATYSDFTQLNSLADVASASGYGDKKIIGVVDSGAIKFYEVGPTDLGSGITMADGKFANPVSSSGGGGSVSFADITGTPSDNVALASDLNSKKSLTTKTTANTGELPNWAAWIADTSASSLTRPMPASPSDGEEVTIRDGGNNAETNNVTPTVIPPTTIPEGVLNVNGQSKKFRYDATGDTWDLVFSDAPAGGGGLPFEVQQKVIYVSNGLISEADTGAKLSNDRREVIDISTHLGSDWVGEELWIETEVFNDLGEGVEGWSDPEFIYGGGGLGVRTNQRDNSIIVQSGGLGVMNKNSASQGTSFGVTTSATVTSLKCRVTVTRLTYNNTPELENLVDVHYIDAGTISGSNRYVFDIATEISSDWVGKDIFLYSEIQFGGDWGDTEWIYISPQGFGVKAGALGADNIVLQTPTTFLCGSPSKNTGDPFIQTNNPTSAACRVKCYKFTDAALSSGVVGSTTFDLNTVSNNSRIVTPISSLPASFAGKSLITINEIQVSGEWGDPGFVYSTGGEGVRSNVIGTDIVTQSGASSVMKSSAGSGNPHGSASTLTSAPSRIKAWRFG